MDTNSMVYIIIILVALIAIFFINKEFFMDKIGKITKGSPRQQGYEASSPIVQQSPVVQQVEAPKPVVVEAPKPAPAEAPKPAPADESWICSCGAVNTRKFCAECGEKRPEKKEPKCPACGYKPGEGEKIPKFCPECGAKMEA